jgi:hypothetical protein
LILAPRAGIAGRHLVALEPRTLPFTTCCVAAKIRYGTLVVWKDCRAHMTLLAARGQDDANTQRQC